jgi:hypothetical protein
LLEPITARQNAIYYDTEANILNPREVKRNHCYPNQRCNGRPTEDAPIARLKRNYTLEEHHRGIRESENHYQKEDRRAIAEGGQK